MEHTVFENNGSPPHSEKEQLEQGRAEYGFRGLTGARITQSNPLVFSFKQEKKISFRAEKVFFKVQIAPISWYFSLFFGLPINGSYIYVAGLLTINLRGSLIFMA